MRVLRDRDDDVARRVSTGQTQQCYARIAPAGKMKTTAYTYGTLTWAQLLPGDLLLYNDQAVLVTGSGTDVIHRFFVFLPDNYHMQTKLDKLDSIRRRAGYPAADTILRVLR